MKKILIDRPVADYRLMINKRIVLCAAAGVFALSLNLLFTLLRTEANHTVMLVLNIAADILAGYFITYYASFYILPQKKRLAVSQRPARVLKGKITGISGDTIRMLGFDCFSVLVDDRKVFLPDCCSVSFQIGEDVTFGLVMNLVTEAEV